MTTDITKINEEIIEKSNKFMILKQEIEKVIVGQKYLLDRMLISLLANGHLLVEGVPGLAKTMAVKTLASALSVNFQRIQFTPDLLPADLIGTQVYSPKTGEFSIKKGPIFSNLILADEINRAPSKVQSALLEAMQERQVTISNETYKMDEPFLVMATQNPIEQEGTYPLPEAQVDRFIIKAKISYPSKAEEKEIINRMAKKDVPSASPVLKAEDIISAVNSVDKIYIDEKIEDYILNLVFATRQPKDFKLDIENLIQYGASPRASIYLFKAAKAHAFINARGYVTPQDVKSIAHDVLRHRILVSYEAEAEEIDSDNIIDMILERVEVP
ncbi:MAG: MoxR family ATPase [Pseudomonadota bacterium]